METFNQGENSMKKLNKRTKIYALKSGRKIEYIGITNNPSRRASEHKQLGKKFSTMKILKSHNKRTIAYNNEKSLIQMYQRQHGGRPPKYNIQATYKSKNSKNRKKQAT